VIGACYIAKAEPSKITEQQWTDLVEFVRNPATLTSKRGLEWPQSRGRWDGPRGYRQQMDTVRSVVSGILHGR
jgi:hypothetical protein